MYVLAKCLLNEGKLVALDMTTMSEAHMQYYQQLSAGRITSAVEKYLSLFKRPDEHTLIIVSNCHSCELMNEKQICWPIYYAWCLLKK